MLPLQTSLAGVPVIAKLEIIRGKGGSQQLEHSERHTTGVHAFKDEADCLLGRLLLQLDDRHLVLPKAFDDLALELVVEQDLVGRVVPVLVVGMTPFGALKETIHREEIGLVLVLGCGHI